MHFLMPVSPPFSPTYIQQLIGGSIFLFRINRNLACVTVFGIFLIGALTTLHGEFIRRMGRRSQVHKWVQMRVLAGLLEGAHLSSANHIHHTHRTRWPRPTAWPARFCP